MGKPTRYGTRQQIKRKINMMYRNLNNVEQHLKDIHDMVAAQKEPDMALFKGVLTTIEMQRKVIDHFREELIG